MNPRNALRLARIFCLSAARARRAKGGSPRGLAKRPVTNIYMSLILFGLAAGLGPFFLGKNTEMLTSLLTPQINVFLPAFTMFMAMLYSLMTEFNQPVETLSTDIVNWLPIQAEDFVLGSTFTTIYFVSPMASILLGVSFGLSSLAGSLDTWALSAALGVFGCFLGALALEIVRGAMNAASGAFSGMKGQGAVILRMALNVLLIVMVSMLFNFSMMMRVIGWFSSSLTGIHFVPILWPSMIILEHISGNATGALVYSALSAILLVIVYYASVEVRKKFWAPTPVSLKLQPVRPSRSRGILGHLGFDSGEAALIRKDLKSITRRREMASIFAMPVMMFLMGLLGTSPEALIDPSTPLEAKTPFIFLCAMGILVLGYQMALRAVGQECEAFMNLLVAPMGVSQLLKAKAAAALIPALPFFALFVALFSYVTAADPMTKGVLIVVGLSVLMAVSSVELVVGARYATFTSGGKTRFISQEGYLIGLLFCMATVGAALSPLALHYLWGFLNLPTALTITELVVITIAVGGFRKAREELVKLLEYNH